MRRVPCIATALAASLAVLALTACGAVGPGAESEGTRETTQQTVSGDITCANIGTEIESIGNDLGTAAESAVTDPAGFIEDLQAIGDRVGQLTESVSDPELKTRMDAVKTAVDELVGSVSDGSVLSDFSGLQAQVQEISDALTAVSDYCRDAA